ncbi:TolC family protein [Paraburkholderia sp. UCT31]|uniref:TolC family protein n=1 Tax=Paraburkholderia sp. UCT31 TaxID=2615209 RepID=UPI00292A5175|nr:TolC family protein [Paraburkholderia sp. UCT31]
MFAAIAVSSFSQAARAGSLLDPFQVMHSAPAQLDCGVGDPKAALSVSDAVVRALCQDPGLAAALYAERAASAQVGVATAAYLPTLSVQSTIGRADTASQFGSASGRDDSVTAALSYVLFDFGARGAKLDETKASLAVQRYARDAQYQQVILNTASSYFAVSSLKLQLDAAVQAQAAAQEALTVALAKYKVGVVARSDVLQAQTTLAQNQLAVVNAQTALRVQEASLKLELGLPMDAPLELAPADVKGQALDTALLDALLARAADQRPDIREAKALVEVNAARITQTRAQYLPSLSVTAQTGTSLVPGSGRTRSSEVLLSLKIPLFSGFAGRYDKESALATKQASEADLANTQRAAALDVFTQRASLLNAQASLAAAQAFSDSAAEQGMVAFKQYKAGVGTMTDLLNAQSQLAQARQQLAQAYASIQTSKLALARALGELSLQSL